MNRPQRNNNPLNLMFAGQKEAIGEDLDHFAIFPTAAAGWRAAISQVRLDKNRNFTVRSFIEKFAPSNENDTENYISFICSELLVEDSHKLSHISEYALVGIMAQMEGYYGKEHS